MSVGVCRILRGGTDTVEFDDDDVTDMLKTGVWKECCLECESSESYECG